MILAVHCEWNDWVNGTCDKTCGAAVQNNTRTKLVEEFNGGTCTGKFWEVLECEVQPCPGNAAHLILNYIRSLTYLRDTFINDSKWHFSHEWKPFRELQAYCNDFEPTICHLV